MLDKIEVNTENILKIANAQFMKQFGEDMNDLPMWIRNNWYNGAEEMLADYNQVVEILNGDK